MKKFNVSREMVGTVVKKGCGIATFILAMVLPHLSTKDVKNMIRYNGNVKYDVVVEAIMESNMFAGDKGKAVALLPRDCDVEVYKAIIQVVNSNMFAHDKLKTIESICEK